MDIPQEEDDFKDPWLEPDKPAKGKGKGKNKDKDKDKDASAAESAEHNLRGMALNMSKIWGPHRLNLSTQWQLLLKSLQRCRPLALANPSIFSFVSFQLWIYTIVYHASIYSRMK